MRVLIIGGTSFIGPHVVAMLAADGHAVTVFHRGRTTLPLPPGVTEMLCPDRTLADRSYYCEFTAAFREAKPDVVLDMIPVTAEAAQAVMDTFRDIAKRIVAISSQDVYRAYGRLTGIEGGAPQPVPISEDSDLRERLFPYRGDVARAADDPVRWMDDYDKILVERVVMGDPHIAGTILRLPMVYGPRDRQHRMFEYLKPMLDGRPAILIDEQVRSWRWTRGYSANVAAAITRAVLDPRAAGRIYNAGEVDALTIEEWIRAIAAEVGWKGDIVARPATELPEPLRGGIATEQDLVTDTSRIRAELDYSEPVSRDEAITRTVAWECENPPARIDPKRFDYAAEDEVLRRIRTTPPPSERSA